MTYKWCVVPQCTNTSVKTPEKLFVSVPQNAKMRKKWLVMARRNPNDIVVNSGVYFCEDHFEMERDIANYNQYKMGFSQRLRLANGVLPSKFHCQGNCTKRLYDTSTSRNVSTKRQKLKITQERVKETESNLKNATGTSNQNGGFDIQVTVTSESRDAESLVKNETMDRSQDEPDQPNNSPNKLLMYYNVGTNLATYKENKYESRHEGLQCANCNEDIIGYKYTCVQCNDYDLCVACEFSGAHADHYVLRVPGPRPYNEVQTVLSRIRKNLTRELVVPTSATGFDSEHTIRLENEFKSENVDNDECEVQIYTPYKDLDEHESGQHCKLSSPVLVKLESTDSKETSHNSSLSQRNISNAKQDKNESPTTTAILSNTNTESFEPQMYNVIDKEIDYKITLPYSNTAESGKLFKICDCVRSKQ